MGEGHLERRPSATLRSVNVFSARQTFRASVFGSEGKDGGNYHGSSALDAALLSTRHNKPCFFQRKPLNVPENESLTGIIVFKCLKQRKRSDKSLL